MANKLSLHVITCVFAIAATNLLHFTTKALHYGPYEFYTITFRWPKAFCKAHYNPRMCRTPIPNYFTILNLSPMYEFNNSGDLDPIPVPPFKPLGHVRGCTQARPKPAEDITVSYLEQKDDQVISDLYIYMPNLVYYEESDAKTEDLNFWRFAYNEHGMCFDNPEEPISYFVLLLDAIQQYNFKYILAKKNIRPYHGTGYPLEKISSTISAKLGVNCTVRCDMNTEKVYQLSQIRLCYDRNHKLRNCPRLYSNCPSDVNSYIIFPFVRKQ